MVHSPCYGHSVYLRKNSTMLRLGQHLLGHHRDGLSWRSTWIAPTQPPKVRHESQVFGRKLADCADTVFYKTWIEPNLDPSYGNALMGEYCRAIIHFIVAKVLTKPEISLRRTGMSITRPTPIKRGHQCSVRPCSSRLVCSTAPLEHLWRIWLDSLFKANVYFSRQPRIATNNQ